MIMAAYFMRTKLSQYFCIFSLKLPHSFSFSFFILYSLLRSLPPPLWKMQIIKTSSFHMIFFRDKLKKIFIIFFYDSCAKLFHFPLHVLISMQWNKIQKKISLGSLQRIDINEKKMWWWQFLRELQAQKQNLYFLSSKNETFVQHFALRALFFCIFIK